MRACAAEEVERESARASGGDKGERERESASKRAREWVKHRAQHVLSSEIQNTVHLYPRIYKCSVRTQRISLQSKMTRFFSPEEEVVTRLMPPHIIKMGHRKVAFHAHHLIEVRMA